MEQGQGMEAPSGGGAQRVADVKLQVSAAGFGKLSIDGHEIGAYVEAVSLSGGGLDSFGDRVLTRVNVTLLADVEFQGEGVQVTLGAGETSARYETKIKRLEAQVQELRNVIMAASS